MQSTRGTTQILYIYTGQIKYTDGGTNKNLSYEYQISKGILKLEITLLI